MSEARRPVVKILLELSIPLIAGVVVALIWANLEPHSYHELLHGSPFGEGSSWTFHFAVNDVFMALFFGIAAKEITESCLPGGALNPIRKAVSPLLATLGGVLGPVAVYLSYVALSGQHAIANGWGIPTATDIAIAWLVARLAFGKGHPAISFLLLLAVADDGVGLAIIAIFYPDPAHPVQLAYLVLLLAAVAGAYSMRRRRVRSYWPYLLGPGVLSWLALHFAHLHPALALVPIVPFMPHAAADEGLFAEDGDAHCYGDTLNRFEHAFKVPVDVGLFAFGLANAGVVASSVGSATVAVFAALVIGKTGGVFGFGLLARRLGFPLPQGMGTRALFVVGLTAALGLTVALFVANVAFADPALQGAAKMGALLSAVVAPVAIMAARLLGVSGVRGSSAQVVSASAPPRLSVVSDSCAPLPAE